MRKLLLLLLLFVFGFTAEKPKVSIFLIGDSTMANKPPGDAPETGWGMVFQDYFDREFVSICNHAVNGRSTKSFISEGRWATILSSLKSGDYVFIQFGHNDSKEQDTSRYAAANTDYRKNLVKFIAESRSKGAVPVLVTPVMRRKFDENGKFQDSHGDYPAAVKAVSKELNVPLIDLHEKSRQKIEALGVEESKMLFLHLEGGFYPKFPKGIIDNTHFSEYGAKTMAGLVSESVTELKLGIASHLQHFGSTDKYVFEIPLIQLPVFRKDTFNIRDYGARNDGIFLNSPAINQTIGACSKNGGGTVLVPKGFWLTGPITLKSNVNLHLEEGAMLQFSDKYADYPLVKTSWEGLEAIRCQSPISAADEINVAITGKGVVDGAGQVWRAVKKEKLTEGQWQTLIASGGILDDSKKIWYPTEKSLLGSKTQGAGNVAAGFNPGNVDSFRDFLRPNMVRLTNCKKVLLEGVTFQNSPAWNLHPMLCENITLKNLTVRNPWYAQNGDGVDIESCKLGVIENCSFDVGDDAICIKSGRDEEGRKRGVPTEKIIVQNCTVFHGHGGFVVGSEMSGGVKELYIKNCNFLGTDVGLRFKTARGRGGIVENIFISDINMNQILGEAVLFDMYYQAKDPVPQPGESNALPTIKAEPLNEGTPQFRNFNIRNIVCKGAETAIMVRGLPEMNIKNVLIENAHFQSNKGFVCIEGENIMLKNVSFFTKNKTVMQVQNSRHITMDHIQYADGRVLLLDISGNRSEDIKILNTDEKKAGKTIAFGNGATEKVLIRK